MYHFHTFSHVLCIPLAMSLSSYTFPYVLHTCCTRSPKLLLCFFFQSYVSIRSAQPFRCFLIALYNCAHAIYIYIYMYIYIYIYPYRGHHDGSLQNDLSAICPSMGSLHTFSYVPHTFHIRSCERAVCVLEPMWVTFCMQAYVPIRSVQTSHNVLTFFYVPIRSWKPSPLLFSFYSLIHTFPHVPGNPLANVHSSVCSAYVPVRSVFVLHTFPKAFATSFRLIIPSIHVPCNPLASSGRKQSWKESIDQSKEEGFPAQAHIYIYLFYLIHFERKPECRVISISIF